MPANSPACGAIEAAGREEVAYGSGTWQQGGKSQQRAWVGGAVGSGVDAVCMSVLVGTTRYALECCVPAARSEVCMVGMGGIKAVLRSDEWQEGGGAGDEYDRPGVMRRSDATCAF